MNADATIARRRGFTLVEMMVAISVGTVLLGLAALLIGSLMKLDRAGRARLAEESRLDRLAQVFRADVHAATGLAPGAPAGELRLILPGGRSVAYRAGPGAVVRARPDGEERFALPPGSMARLDVGRSSVGLTVGREPGHPGLRVEAVPGTDHRFADPGDGRE